METPEVLGIDDFAFRKANRYGTILVDLEKRRPLDLLPDREGKTLQTWLKAHPGVKIVVRDRSPVYANAVTTVCPTALQVADRWHLLKNLSENLVKFLDTKAAIIKQVAQQVAAQNEGNQMRLTKPDSSSCIGDSGPMVMSPDSLKRRTHHSASAYPGKNTYRKKV
jgi:transposase